MAGAKLRLHPMLLRVIALFVAIVLFMFAFPAALVLFGNDEFTQRSPQSATLALAADAQAANVNLLIHRILPDENAIEASVVVEISPEYLARTSGNAGSCFSVLVDDRSPERVFPPRRFDAQCHPEPGYTFMSYETPRFILPAYQSVVLFPFDDVEIWPIVTLRGYPNSPPANYHVIKFLSGRQLRVTGNDLNWEIHFFRSTNEKILILVGASLFVGLTLVVTSRIIREQKPLSGTQDLVALAGYLIAAIGFRELLGFNRTSGTSAFEIGVFLAPFVLLSSVILFRGHKVDSSARLR